MYKAYVPPSHESLNSASLSLQRPSDREEIAPHGLWCASQQVIAKPEVSNCFFYFKQVLLSYFYQVKTVEILPTYEFVILACDGLFDVFTNQEAVNFVRRQLCIYGNISKVAEALVNKAIERGSQDNISVLICCLNQLNN